MKQYIAKYLAKDLLSSLVVFLVALPLCLGIAIASGVPPIYGILSGIIGGLLVGSLSGCPLQVSGPAAGIAVMVFELISKFGLPALTPLGIIVGLVQLLTYRLRLAEYFQAISPALIRGLLSGIGVLILASQIHVAFDSTPVGTGLVNILQIPNSFQDFVILEGSGRDAFVIAILTLISIISWDKLGGRWAKIIPAPLFAIIVVVLGAILFSPQAKFISFSANIFGDLNFFNISSFELMTPSFILSCIAIGFVASAETLLSVAAVDKLASRGHSDFNKEIFAQGVGNTVAGFLGIVPITGVIVRSSANIEAGAATRGSAIFHGLWLFLLAFFFPDILTLVPISALAGILLYTGWKLLDLKSIPSLFKKSKAEGAVFLITFVLIASFDLLTGVIVGFTVSLGVLLYKLHELEIHREESAEAVRLTFKGVASFLQVPRISKHLPRTTQQKNVIVDLQMVRYMDWAVEEQLMLWRDIQSKRGVNAKVFLNRTTLRLLENTEIQGKIDDRKKARGA